jgi:hypothetical protein
VQLQRAGAGLGTGAGDRADRRRPGQGGEAYCAHELDIDPGQQVEGLRPLNGWLWCRNLRNGELGWLPQEKLRLLGS